MRRSVTYGLVFGLLALAPTAGSGSDSLPFLPGLVVAGPGAMLIPVPARVQGRTNTLTALQPVYVPGSRGGWSAAVAIGSYSTSSWGSANDWGDVGFGTSGVGAYDYVLNARYSPPVTTGYYAPFFYADPRYFGS